VRQGYDLSSGRNPKGWDEPLTAGNDQSPGAIMNSDVVAVASPFSTAKDVADFLVPDANSHWRAYADFHAQRYLRLLEIVRGLPDSTLSGTGSVVDVGPGMQTRLLSSAFPNVDIITVGYEHHLETQLPKQSHVQYDLNWVMQPDSWPPLPHSDLVLMCEIIEHLYASPVAVLSCAASWMKPGARLVVQTPNAAALAKRVRFLGGRIPWATRANFVMGGINDGHFREYVAAELEEAGRQAGLEVEATEIENYFARSGRMGRAYNRLTDHLPRSLRQGITVVYVRP
jgi:hypothetical protein